MTQEIKLEVGKFYRTRGGEKRKCIFISEEIKNIYFQALLLDRCGVAHFSNINGRSFHSSEDSRDIVSEWKDTITIKQKLWAVLRENRVFGLFNDENDAKYYASLLYEKFEVRETEATTVRIKL